MENKKNKTHDAAKEYILDALKKNGAITVDSVWEDYGGDAARKAIRSLERDQIAGSWRRKLYLADGENFAFKKGKVRQAGIGRFGLFAGGEPEAEELGYFPAKAAQSVLDGDEVVAFCAKNQTGSWEAFPTKLLKREKKTVLLRSEITDGGGVFWVLDGRSFSPAFDLDRPDLSEAGEIVLASPGDTLFRSGAKAKCIERLGNENDPEIESKVAWAARYGEKTAPPADELFADHAPRADMEAIAFVTIDGANSKDFDDAVFCEKTERGHKLIVAIADVSAFVSVGGGMDQYAREKMTSVYLPHEVIPMLSPSMANKECSLNPNERRPALVCSMEIGAEGDIEAFAFERAWIRSAQRLTYEQADQFWAGKDIGCSGAVAASLLALKDVAHELRVAGRNSGRLDLGDEECEFVLGENRKIQAIIPSPRLLSHKVVEDCMLAANRSAAKFIDDTAFGGVFRNHFALGAAEREELVEIAKDLGIWNGEEGIKSKDLSDWMAAAKASGEERRMRSEILSRMSSAKYESKNEGHFSLAAEEYCHYTSPIRRYADLVMHRLIKSAIDKKEPCYSQGDLEEITRKASELSARSAGAETDARKQLLCEFAARQEGHEKKAEASSVSERGIWAKAFEPSGGWMPIYLAGKEMEKRGWKWSEDSREWSREGDSPIRDGGAFRVEIGRVDMASRKIVAQESPALLELAVETNNSGSERKAGLR